jgi:hypothetical protein
MKNKKDELTKNGTNFDANTRDKIDEQIDFIDKNGIHLLKQLLIKKINSTHDSPFFT